MAEQTEIPAGTPRTQTAVVGPTTGPFAIDWPFANLDDVVVTLQGEDGVVEDQVRGVDYDITATANDDGIYPDGEITFLAPIEDTTLTRYRLSSIERESNFPLTGYLSRVSLNAELNRQTMALQDLRTEMSETMRPATGRGNWAPDTTYYLRDVVTDDTAGANTKNIYMCVVEHESGVWATDLAADKWVLLIDFDSIIDGLGTLTEGGNNDFTGTNTFAGTSEFDGPLVVDGAADFDGTVDMTGSASVTVPTAATTPVAAGHNTTAASTAFVQTLLAATKPVGGLLWSVNGADASNDIDIAVGAMADTTGTIILRLASAITKRLDAAWAVGTGNGGLDTGAVGNSEYYGWLIGRSDTGVVDFLWSLSATAPTMPANYDFKAGPCAWVKRSGGVNLAWRTYEESGGGVEFQYVAPILDVDLTNTLTTSRRTDAVSVPKNFSVSALLRVMSYDATTANARTLVGNPEEANVAPAPTASPLSNQVGVLTSLGYAIERYVRTSATGTIYAISDLATVDNYRVVTVGFRWSRR